MSQVFIDTFYTYSQFDNIIFGHLSKSQKSAAQTTLIRDYNN